MGVVTREVVVWFKYGRIIMAQIQLTLCFSLAIFFVQMMCKYVFFLRKGFPRFIPKEIKHTVLFRRYSSAYCRHARQDVQICVCQMHIFM